MALLYEGSRSPAAGDAADELLHQLLHQAEAEGMCEGGEGKAVLGEDEAEAEEQGDAEHERDSDHEQNRVPGRLLDVGHGRGGDHPFPRKR